MAIQKAVQVQFPILGDGSTTSFSFDLVSDPYQLPTGIANWFVGDRKFPSPVAAENFSNVSFTASLSGTVVTLEFSSAPLSSVSMPTVTILFD